MGVPDGPAGVIAFLAVAVLTVLIPNHKLSLFCSKERRTYEVSSDFPPMDHALSCMPSGALFLLLFIVSGALVLLLTGEFPSFDEALDATLWRA